MIDKEYYGPWAVIVGGSEGVGSAYAEYLAKAGINQLLIARKPGPLEATAQAVRDLGVEVRTLSQDLLADDAIENIRAAVEDVEVGLLIFNAGANNYGHEFVTGDLERFRAVAKINIDRLMDVTYLFGAPMKERGRGGIIMTGSFAGLMGTDYASVYSASKAFGTIFAEGLWLELKDHGVHVLEIMLGVTRTPAMERMGLKFDRPGLVVSEPAAVAAEALRHLKDGPVWVVEDHYEAAQQRTGFPRGPIVEREAVEHRALMNL